MAPRTVSRWKRQTAPPPWRPQRLLPRLRLRQPLRRPRLPRPRPPRRPQLRLPAAGAVSVSSPMPGTILDVKVAAGAAVKAGDVLCILEAMKMENEIVAPQDGTVAGVHCNKGDSVNVGDLLVSLN